MNHHHLFGYVPVAACVALLAGCPNENAPDPGGLDESGGTGGCVDPEPSLPPAGHPNFSGVVSSEEYMRYDRMAVGHVVQDASATVCCQD